MGEFKRAAFGLFIANFVLFVGWFMALWFWDPPFVQSDDAINDPQNPFSATDKTTAQTLESKYDVKICKKCSLDGFKFVGFSVLPPTVLFIVGIVVLAVLSKKGSKQQFPIAEQ